MIALRLFCVEAESLGVVLLLVATLLLLCTDGTAKQKEMRKKEKNIKMNKTGYFNAGGIYSFVSIQLNVDKLS